MDAVVARAQRDPMPGVDRPGPHQIYRWPRVAVEPRQPGPLAPGHVRIEVERVGVCGTDLHAVRCDPVTGYVLGTAPLEIGPEGRVLGHEGIGRVVAVGDGVAGIERGAWLAFESIEACLSCAACRRGRFNQCPHALLVGMQRDGLFAHVADLPARLAHDVSDLAASESGRRAAACIEPAACSFVALTLAQLRPGDDVLVFGGGPIGLFAAMLARLAFGAASVRMVEPLAMRRDLARKWVDHAYDVEEFFAERPGRPVDVVIEASGELRNVDRALLRLGPNGRIALLARSGAPLALRRMDHVITNNLSIVGSRGHLGGAVGDVLKLYREARVPLHEAVTGVGDGLAALERALSDPESVTEAHCKLLVRP